MNTESNFFLTTGGENDELTSPRACWIKDYTGNSDSDVKLLIEIDPPAAGQSFGMGGKEISRLVISARYRATSMFPIEQWPCHVYVARILDEALTLTQIVAKNQLEVIAWGRLYPTLKEAEADANKYLRS